MDFYNLKHPHLTMSSNFNLGFRSNASRLQPAAEYGGKF